MSEDRYRKRKSSADKSLQYNRNGIEEVSECKICLYSCVMEIRLLQVGFCEKMVFRLLLKVWMGRSLMCWGTEFQTMGDAQEKSWRWQCEEQPRKRKRKRSYEEQEDGGK